MEKTQINFDQLSEVLGSINAINNNTIQVATAAEQQSQVSEDINKRIVAIGDGSKTLAMLGGQLNELSTQVHQVVAKMNEQLNRLKS
ncbi:hypothetical protein [Neptunicella marina]|uniref:Uncharacterized protein n=1 Tax=Neptunicella marina TaxID=2125989 RepID=A0A8J6M4B3_9ALTE|nr:hypothetical protein [Neptunicella marina]MBC3765966.1 hypothetical protein [Neptunicella marina]